ncbi:MAG: hypothetical protein ABI614_14525 [Planctomycetota bacterium]
MITSYAQQVVSTFLRLVPSRNQQRDASTRCVADPMQVAFATLQGRCQAESVDEARRMLMNEYVKQLSAANNDSRRTFRRRRIATEISLGRRDALDVYKQTKPYAERLLADRLI